MWPLFLRSRLYKYSSTALLGLCFSFHTFSQSTPIPTPKSVEYPGIIESLEKLIQIDNTKYKNKHDQLAKNGSGPVDFSGVNSLEIDPDYLNSVILHSNPGYIKLASTNKCRFYDTLINNLLRSAEGDINNVFVTYVNKNSERGSAVVSKRDFVSKVVGLECPETPKLIEQFQVKNLDKTIQSTSFDAPTGEDQCHNIYLEKLSDPKTPYYCNLHEFMKEANGSRGSPKDLKQRKALSKVLAKKLGPTRKDYLQSLCENLEDEALFCQDFLNVSFWSKVASGAESRIYAEDICKNMYGVAYISDAQLAQCIARIKKENDHCLYPGGRSQGLTPAPQCDTLATALNYSSLRSDYRDCPASSDQQAATNMGRILLNISKDKIPPIEGACSTISSGITYNFNNRFNNDENWGLEACYDNTLSEKEICHKTFFGRFGNDPASYNLVVADIIRKTRGADARLKCQMVDSEDYNPMLLQYKSGCYIIYERQKCYLSQCDHKIIYNAQTIDYIKLKNTITLDYFPSNIVNEKYSQQYMLTHDYGQKGKALKNLTNISSFFQKNKSGIIHGVGCAEDLLPSFFKIRAFNQCTPLPFIIDGMIKEKNKVSFVTRSAADTLQAPRLINWSLIYSAVKGYQNSHPLKLWTLYGLD